MMKWPRPDTVKELRSFMGFVAYYSKFMKDFITITSPLQQLIVDVNTSSGKVISKRLSKTPKVVLNDKSIEAFDSIKTSLSSEPVLVHTIWGDPLRLKTDASNIGNGSILIQKVDGKYGVVAIPSKFVPRSGKSNPQ